MPYAAVNDQGLYYEDTGGDGPVLVFSHGLLMDHSMFASQIAALSDRYRCIAWDERGHGRTASAEPLAPFSYYDSANALRVPGWARIDLGARYRIDVSGHELTLRARIDNVTDENYYASAGGFTGLGYLVVGAPRSFVFSIAVDL